MKPVCRICAMTDRVTAPTRPVTRAGRARTAVAGPGAASVVLVVPVAGYFACGWARTTVLMILSAMVWRLVSHSGNSQPT